MTGGHFKNFDEIHFMRKAHFIAHAVRRLAAEIKKATDPLSRIGSFLFMPYLVGFCAFARCF